MKRNLCIVRSDSTSEREYEVSTASAMKCAEIYGRGEGGEVITVYKDGKPVSEVRWVSENGGRYVRAVV